MNDLLFDPPWYAPVLLAVIAIGLLYQGVQTQKNQLKIAGVVAAALAAGWLVMADIVETGSEIAARQTKELAAAVDAKDWQKFKSLLDPKVHFAIYADREQLTNGAKVTAEHVAVKDIVISGLTVANEPGGYAVTFTATASIGDIERRAPTNWKFLWANAPDGSEKLYQIDVLPSAGMGTDPILGRLSQGSPEK